MQVFTVGKPKTLAKRSYLSDDSSSLLIAWNFESAEFVIYIFPFIKKLIEAITVPLSLDRPNKE